MTSFEWSPEAIKAAARAFGRVCAGPYTDAQNRFVRPGLEDILAAATKVQPVVALPPCPTCGGSGERRDQYPSGAESNHVFPCPACNGSGHDRLIPGSEIREWIAAMREVPWTPGAQQAGTPVGYGRALDDLRRWLDEREARP